MEVKDIDFDELDRAVNSAISKNNLVNDEASIPSVSSPSEPIVNSLPKPEPTPATPVTLNRQTISRPATGRFMDMVHSSNNMRVSVPERPALRPLSSSTITNSTPVQASTGPFIRPAQPQKNDVIKNDNPDVDIDRISDEIDKTLNVNTDVQESPFLQGAKVEKRPLNAFVSQQDSSRSALAEPIKVSPVDDMPNNQEKIDTPLPAELESELLSIEASEVEKADESPITDNFEEDSAEMEDTREILSEPVDNHQDFATEQNDISADKDTKEEASLDLAPKQISSNNSQNPITPITPTFIPQQYTEMQDTNEKEIGSIYDTNSYHKAMAPLPKKKSGWMWVVWIALLMIASVGAGIAVYFFVLPQL